MPMPDVTLSGLQIAVMRVLWERGEASTADVASELARTRAIKHTTVGTLLTRLARRDLVAQRREGRQLLYRARVGEEAVRRSMVADLVGALFDGDARQLVAHLVDQSEIAPGDAARARRRLARETRHGD
jgi:predicted transcriptional regulator